MLLLSIFLLGLFIGCLLTYRHQVYIQIQREKKKFSKEIELRATPDEYLSEYDLLKKRYYEAKFKRLTQVLNNPLENLVGIPMTEEEINIRKASKN